MKMAETFMKLGRFHDAIDMATFHIAVMRGGSTFHSRFLRANAFIQTKQYGHAAADLINCRNEDPSSTEVAASIEKLHSLWEVDDEYFDRHPEEAKKEAVYRDLAPCTANFDLDCESDTEESTHFGFGAGKPCLAYNHGYCRHGRNCRSRHAPDSRSIRDRLGHNVCVFSILGRCHFAAGSRCWYSHSTDNLPEHGWWRDPEYIKYYRTVYDILKATESTSVLDLMLGGDMNGRWLPFERRDRFAAGVATLGGSESFRSEIMDRCEQARAGLLSRPDLVNSQARMFGSGGLGRRRSDWDDYDYSDYEVYSDHSDGEFGALSHMLEEMMSQGIKPWDDDFGFY
uniref:C3H1-type domain-containing protein n=1 Tax=Mycena chlorophos TaxID=658473 RepID=A0ABQ0M624_MYCCL|nr:predicted protein [Mycena chlorophos]